DIDVFDIELNTKNVDEFVQVVKAMEPTFGGINLEDIKAPECFEIEKRLKEELSIPVMHDDQHGTAIISAAALLNALDLVDKKIDEIKMVISGAGAAAISGADLYMALGVKEENIYMVDSKGVLNERREGLDAIKSRFVRKTSDNTLEEIIKKADVFIGLSMAGVLTKDMVRTMAKNPIIFAMANPDPEISYEDAVAAREDVIMATGRSDYPNQVNNVLGFPFIFRGALDVRATKINEEMKLAAVHALAELAKEPVPDFVTMAYGKEPLTYGPDYIIPKPLDPRLLTAVAPAVAKAAMESGVARKPIKNWEAYKLELNKRLGVDNLIVRSLHTQAKKDPKRVVFAEADNIKVLKAAQIVEEEGVAYPILLGSEKRINALMEEHHIEFRNLQIIDPRKEEWEEKRNEYGNLFFEKRHRRGYNLHEAKKIMRERNYFGCMMVETGEADALISGLTRNYPDTIRPALEVIGLQKGIKRVAGMYIVLRPEGPLFLADTTINIDPTVEELADITYLAAKEVEKYNVKPVIAMLSYSNFGSSQTEEARKIRKSVALIHEKYPELVVDGEIQASLAFDKETLKDNYPFSPLAKKDVNTLIFPNLSSGNIAYNLLNEVHNFELVGPILMGLNKPVHILQLGSSVRQIANMVALAVTDAQSKK
ncbi:MAG TPA: phosphate acyltransferase, partial [Chitinophagaceae bacterium]|nr:phosphate acyltransferase [Chitinophagaceae bacterium]